MLGPPPASGSEGPALDAVSCASSADNVAKRADAPYLPGRRSSAWLKVKCIKRREFVVGGWSEGQGGRSGSIGSLAVGCWGLDPATGKSTGRLHYVGLVGSGLSGDLIRQLTEVFRRTARDDSPFAEKLIGKLHYVEPLLVAEVAFNEITESATLRQPSLQGFRTDLDPNNLRSAGRGPAFGEFLQPVGAALCDPQ